MLQGLAQSCRWRLSPPRHGFERGQHSEQKCPVVWQESKGETCPSEPCGRGDVASLGSRGKSPLSILWYCLMRFSWRSPSPAGPGRGCSEGAKIWRFQNLPLIRTGAKDNILKFSS